MMQILSERQGAVVWLWVCVCVVLVVTGFCYEEQRTVEVVGVGECADCKENNVMSSFAFSGLRVTVDCKKANGELETRGDGELDERGNFKISVSGNIDVKQECYAQLHSATAAPCPAHDGMENTKIVIINTQNSGNHTLLAPAAGKLTFSSLICTSAFFFKHPLFHHPKYLPPPPPFPVPTFKKPSCPPKVNKPLPPPVPVFNKPLPPPAPVFNKPLPPPAPVFKKPLPPPTPVFKKPLPPPAPVFKKPLPPPVPVVNKPLPPPVPVVDKPLPPPVPAVDEPLPPFFNKPLPQFPRLPPFLKKPCPPLTDTLPKYFFQHPKLGEWPPLPPFFSPHS